MRTTEIGGLDNINLLTIYLTIHEVVDLGDDPRACNRLDNDDLTMATFTEALLTIKILLWDWTLTLRYPRSS